MNVINRFTFVVIVMTLLSAIAPVSMAENSQSADQAALLIDVRTPQEFASGHLKGAINIEYQQIVEKIPELTSSKKQKIEVYCRSGNRSGIAKKMLNDAGYEEVVNLGGFESLKNSRETVIPKAQ